MDFAFFAMAFNIKKMCAMAENKPFESPNKTVSEAAKAVYGLLGHNRTVICQYLENKAA
jgi:hypothetical protein